MASAKAAWPAIVGAAEAAMRADRGRVAGRGFRRSYTRAAGWRETSSASTKLPSTPSVTVLPIARSTGIDDSASRKNTRSEEHTSELQSLMRNSYAVFCLKKKKNHQLQHHTQQ